MNRHLHWGSALLGSALVLATIAWVTYATHPRLVPLVLGGVALLTAPIANRLQGIRRRARTNSTRLNNIETRLRDISNRMDTLHVVLTDDVATQLSNRDALLSAAQNEISRTSRGLDRAVREHEKLHSGQNQLTRQVASIEATFSAIDAALTQHETSVDNLSSQLANMDTTVDRLKRNDVVIRRKLRILEETPTPPKPPRTQSSSDRPTGIATTALPKPVDVHAVTIRRPSVKAAVILDGFSELALKYEWDQVALPREGWREVLDTQLPDLLFLESAWNGNGGDWRLAMTAKKGVHQDLVDLITYCRSCGIPTVLWNKEDPPNYARFIDTAKLVDHVFTVDANCLESYRRDLGHDRVSLLPFAAQPRIHNPIRHSARASKPVAFAGTYFAERHEDRREQLTYLLDAAKDFDLEIFSRMQGGDPRYSFPDEYAQHIVGSIPYEQMLQAYKAYKVFLNANTVTDSPTMCSRRLFELAACGTPTVSGPAASIEHFFGDTVNVVRDGNETRAALSTLLQHEELRDRLGTRSVRRVMNSHTYGHRVDHVLSTIGKTPQPMPRDVSMIVPTRRPDMLGNVKSFAASQNLVEKELVLVVHGFSIDAASFRAELSELGVSSVQIVPAESDILLGSLMNMGVEAASGHFISKMDDDNFYGPNYLCDLLHAFNYTDATVVGKWAHYTHLASKDLTILRFPDHEHRYVRLVQGGTMTMHRTTARDLQFENLPRRVDTTFFDKVKSSGGRVYAADRFNFVSKRAASPEGHTWRITDEELLAKSSKICFVGDPTKHVTV